jgi:L-alanine-DL-glutamate epimerase-like enolase superfamily enzyme
MYDWTSYYGRRGVVIHAMSAVDIALWTSRQVEGQAGGRPAGLASAVACWLTERSIPWARRARRSARQYRSRAELGQKAIKIVADRWRLDVRKAETIIMPPAITWAGPPVDGGRGHCLGQG